MAPSRGAGPGGPEMLRNAAAIMRDPLDFIARMRDRYGDLVLLPIPGTPTYLVNSGPGAQDVLVGGARMFDKDTVQYRSLAAVTGEGLLTARTAAWREPRRIVQPAFAHATLPALAGLVTDEAVALTRRWERLPTNAVVDVEAAMMDLTLGVVGRALFGDDLGRDREALAAATLEALDVVIRRSRVPVAPPLGWPTPANRRLRRSLAQLDRAVDRLVQHRRAAAPQDGGLLIDLLLRSPLPARAVRDQIVTFLVAGHETAATGLTWALWLLAADRAEQDRLAALPDSGETGGPAPAAQACADEALRLYAPAWVVSRRTERAATVCGAEVPAGALAIVSPYVLQRDPRVWPQPDAFDPERFRAGLSRAQRSAYLPFGAGPRLCIGREFARWEMAIVLAELCRGFRWARPTTAAPRLLPGVTLRPAGGMRLSLTPRPAPEPPVGS